MRSAPVALPGGDEIMVRSGAVQVQPGVLPMIDAMLLQLSARTRLPTPSLWLHEYDEPNAFAAGQTPYDAAVAVTAGLLAELQPSEIRAVLAHELGHIYYGHASLRTTATIAALRRSGYNKIQAAGVSALASLLITQAFPVTSLILAGASAVAGHFGQQQLRQAEGFDQMCEYHADAFAAAIASGSDLTTSLLKMDSVQHCQLPDWTRGFLFSNGSTYSDHPPAMARIQAVIGATEALGTRCARCRAPLGGASCVCGGNPGPAKFCGACGSALDTDDRYCGTCGIRALEAPCRACGRAADPRAAFCPGCGFDLP